MTNHIKETVETYHTQFSSATTDAERQQLADRHQSFIDQLTPDQRTLAREIAKPYLTNAIAMAEKMEPMLQRAKDLLARRREAVG